MSHNNNGNVVGVVLADGKLYHRICFGDKTESKADWQSSCLICGASKGEVHKVECPEELCPKCRRYSISCKC